MKPTVLIAATSQWFPTARLAMALANAGWLVEGVCPTRHPLRATRAVQQIHTYYGLAPLMSFAKAIAATKPDLIVPGDDLSTHHLHHLYRRERGRGERGQHTCALIERSFGSPESFPVVYERAAFMEAARQEGIRVPKTAVVATAAELEAWTAQIGFPAVLKANGTSGGDGVRIVRGAEEAKKAFQALQAPPLLARAVKRALINRDKTLVRPSLLRRRSVVNVQTFVAGREATSTVACWQGSVLAALHFEVINKRSSAGPATVVRLIESAEMSTAVEKMVRRLNLSGLHGFDFMLETQTGNAFLIEINPRTTQVGHLALGPGRDLPAALYAALSGNAIQAASKVTENSTITLFPQEWMRDPASPFLRSGYHDVPWEEPELMAACMRRGRKNSSSKAQQEWDQNLAPVRAPRL